MTVMTLPKTPPWFLTAIVSSAQTGSPPECMNERMHVCSIVSNSLATPWTVAHSSVLAWAIPWAEEPGGLQSMGLPKVRPEFATKQQQQQQVMT